MIKVLLVDDQSLLRMGFQMILEAEPDIEVVGQAADGATGISMASALHPDVVLMDVRMPGVDGIQATAAITAAAPASSPTAMPCSPSSPAGNRRSSPGWPPGRGGGQHRLAAGHGAAALPARRTAGRHRR